MPKSTVPGKVQRHFQGLTHKRMYVRTCSNHAHTHTQELYILRMYVGLTGIFKDNSMSKMKVWDPQLVHNYKPSEAGF